MSLTETRRVQLAVQRAAARPGAFGTALVAAWTISRTAGLLATLLAATTGYLGWVVGTLLVAPEVGGEALPGGDEPLALPPGEAPRPRRDPTQRKGLPPELRTRFQELHASVHGMLENWPSGLVLPLERSHLEQAPEAFRELAYLRAGLGDGEPGAERVEARLRSLEEQVARLRSSWSLLVVQGSERDRALEDLERTGDALEALLEVGDP